jgi:multidrug efflux pump subunit AcrA (membrane-fusion protein)
MELEVRIDRLEEALISLAQAQARTETRIGELAQAQARTEARVEQLAQAQARTENAVLTLAQQVGRLSETIGFTLEDLAREVTPAYLAHHHGIHVPQLDRRFFTVDGDEVEVDLYGEGVQDSRAIVVIGEVRSRIYGRDVENAAHRGSRLRPQLPGIPVVVLFGFLIHPSAQNAAQRLDAIVISSSGRLPRW